MSSPNTDERLNRLARVRENQRRSRAKKQQYIEELEKKVAICNTQAQQKDIEHRIVLQKLENENVNLRGLLNRIGFDNGYLDVYLQASLDPATSEKVAIPSLKNSSPCRPPSSHTVATANTAGHCLPSPPSAGDTDCYHTRSSSCTPGPKLNAEPVTMGSLEANVPPATALVTQWADGSEAIDPTSKRLRLPSIASLCDCGPGSVAAWPDDENSQKSTLCASAEELIHRYNIQGIDINLIKERLWPGFRNGGAGGCRVQNNVLMELLDELSGNIP